MALDRSKDLEKQGFRAIFCLVSSVSKGLAGKKGVQIEVPNSSDGLLCEWPSPSAAAELLDAILAGGIGPLLKGANP